MMLSIFPLSVIYLSYLIFKYSNAIRFIISPLSIIYLTLRRCPNTYSKFYSITPISLIFLTRNPFIYSNSIWFSIGK